MSQVHRIELLCAIDPQRESIHGEMSDRQGNTLPFTGWAEFAGALTTLTSRAEGETAEADPSRDGSEINQFKNRQFNEEQ